MKLLVRKEPLMRFLKGAHRALFACGVLLLGYFGFVVADAWVCQRRESAALDRLLRDRGAVNEATTRLEPSRRPKGAPSAVTDGLIGRILIPRLLLSVLVVEGIDKSTLRRSVGHIPGTALPGQPGNVGLAGHRDTLFRPLKDLRLKDEVQFSTPRGNFMYEVESLQVVEPDNVGVLDPSGDNVLTLVTCYPFYYVGPAPKRFVVRARQVAAQTAGTVNRGMMKDGRRWGERN
jgi:sortase A